MIERGVKHLNEGMKDTIVFLIKKKETQSPCHKQTH